MKQDTERYDHTTGLHLDADDISGVTDNALSYQALDRNGLKAVNALCFLAYLFAINTVTEMTADLTYDIDEGKSKFRLFFERTLPRFFADLFQWWDGVHWGWKVGIGLALLILAAVLTFFTAGGFAAAAVAWKAVGAMAVKAAIGIATSAMIGGLIAAVTGGNVIEGFTRGLVEGVFWTGVFSFAKAAINAIKAA